MPCAQILDAYGYVRDEKETAERIQNKDKRRD